MKVLKLYLQNINSLKGEWTIDFSSSEYHQNGLFAIIGETGAGKSTILDALCLALYGATPRIGKITKSQNDIMHIGTSYCHSEALIQIKNKLYRFTFNQRRANNKPNGNLQDKNREIAEYCPKQGFVVLESKATKVEKLSESLLSMTFEQFTRSCLLAQGSFGAFLMSNDENRGAMLEKITHTQIYTEIGKRAFEKNKSLQQIIEQKTEQLHGNDNSIKESLAQTKSQIQKIKNNIKTYEHIIKIRTEKINAIDRYQKLKQALADCQNQLDEQTAALQEFEPQKTKLNQAKHTQKITSVYRDYIQSQEEVQKHQACLDEYQSALPHYQAQQSLAKEAFDTANQKRQQKEQAVNTAYPYFLRAYELKNQAAHLDKQQSKHQQKIQELIEHIKSLQNTTDSYRKNLKDINAKIQNEQAVINRYAPIAPLLEKLPQLQEPMVKWQYVIETITQHNHQKIEKQKHREQLQAKKAKLNEQKTAAANAIAEIWAAFGGKATNIDEVLDNHHKKLSKSDKLIDTIGTLAQKNAERIKTKQQLDKYEQDYAAQKALLNTKEESEKLAKSHYKQASDALKHTEQAHHLGQQLQVLQAQFATLVEGHPCPVCGSKTHPYKTNPPNSHLNTNDSPTFDEVQAAKDYAQDRYMYWQKTTLAVQEQAAALRHLEQDIYRTKNTLSEQTRLLSVELTQFICSYNALITHSLAQDTAMDKLKEALDSYQTAILSWQTDHKHQYNAAKEAKAQLSKLSQAIGDYDGEIYKLEGQLSGLDDNEQPMTFSYDTQNHCLQTILAILNPYQDYFEPTLYQQMQTNQASQNAYNAINSIYQTLQEQKSILTDAQSNQQNHQVEYRTIQTKLDNNIALQNAKQDEKKQLLNELGDIQEQINTNNHAKKTLFTDRDLLNLVKQLGLEEAQQHLKHQETLCRTAENQAQDDYNQQNSALDALNNNIQRTKNELDTAKNAHKAFGDDLKKALYTQGFTDINAYLTACLSDDEFLALMDTQSQLTQRYETLNTKQAELYHSLTAHLKNAPTHWQIDQPIDHKQRNKQQLWQNRQTATKAKLDAVYRQQGKLEERYEQLQYVHQTQKTLLSDIETLKKDALVWQTLSGFIGCRTGKKYRDYVQELTLDALLYLANEYLAKITDRYSLVRGENLVINIADFYQGGTHRPSKTLSGGEVFLVSLSLALGLAAINSQNVQIDSLFLDEGFGTLDEETLEVALNALEKLQEQGKMIGIISHVGALKERIATKIMVNKQSAGVSVLSGAGVSKGKKL